MTYRICLLCVRNLCYNVLLLLNIQDATMDLFTLTIPSKSDTEHREQWTAINHLANTLADLYRSGLNLGYAQHAFDRLMPANPVLKPTKVIVIHKDGTRLVATINKHGQFHSYNDEPAITNETNFELWARHGDLHRYSGPAFITKRRNEWFIHGTQVSSSKSMIKLSPEEFHEDIFAGIITYNFL